jgi:hypothetical protein
VEQDRPGAPAGDEATSAQESIEIMSRLPQTRPQRRSERRRVGAPRRSRSAQSPARPARRSEAKVGAAARGKRATAAAGNGGAAGPLKLPETAFRAALEVAKIGAKLSTWATGRAMGLLARGLRVR